MRGDLVRVDAASVNRERLRRGLGRMEFYELIGCDPRTGFKIVCGVPVHIHTARRVAEVLGWSIPQVIVIDERIAC